MHYFSYAETFTIPLRRSGMVTISFVLFCFFVFFIKPASESAAIWAGSILVPRASVSFGHVVGQTEGSGSSNYQMSVNHGHPVTHNCSCSESNPEGRGERDIVYNEI